MDKNTIGGFISILRKANGMTQQELADRLHVSNKTVSRWECDESSPELALIPVMAELFGVTSDELLRGQRIENWNAAASLKTQKQISYLMKSSMAKYRTRTLLSAFFALLAFLSMIIFGFGLRVPVVGLGMVTILVVASLLFQANFLSRLRIALDGDDPELKLTASPLYRAWQMFFMICYLNIFVCMSLMPFIIGYQSVDSIMPRNDWLFFLPVYLFGALLLCLLLSFFVPKIISRQDDLGAVYPLAEKRNRRLKLICICIGAVCLVALGAGQTAFESRRDIRDIAAGQTFSSFEDFREYAQTPVSADEYGNIAEVYDETTGRTRNYEESDRYLWTDTYLEDAAGKRYPYTWKNRNISAIDSSDDLSSITVYSQADQAAYNRYVETEKRLFSLLYLLATAIPFLVYWKKRTKITPVLDRNNG